MYGNVCLNTLSFTKVMPSQTITKTDGLAVVLDTFLCSVGWDGATPFRSSVRPSIINFAANGRNSTVSRFASFLENQFCGEWAD